MAGKDSSLHDYYVIAAMLLALLLYFIAAHYLWSWLTADLRDAGWVCNLVSGASSPGAKGMLSLAGIEGRFVWAASAFVLFGVIVAIVSASLYILLAMVTRWRMLLGGVVILVLLGVLLASVFAVETDYKRYLQVLFSVQDCTFTNRQPAGFDFFRYLLVILQSTAGATTLNGIAVIEQLLPVLVLVCNVALIAVLIALSAPHLHPLLQVETLSKRFAYFRLLFFFGSGLFTAIALYHLSQYGWLAQILQAQHNPGAESLRHIQRGVTLYISTLNTMAIVILFLPPGWILWRQAQTLSETELPELSRQARADWLADKQLTLFAGPTMRILVAAAPLLVSGAIMLLEKALM